MTDIFYSIFIEKYFTLSGRASRREYWVGQFIFWVMHALAGAFSLFIFKNFFSSPNLDDAFDLGLRFTAACAIFSLPTYMWRHVGILALLAVGGFVGLAIMPLGHLWQVISDAITHTLSYIAPVALPALPVLLVTLYLLPPSISVTVRRFHDRGLPGFTLFFIPEFVGLIIDLLAGSSKP
ncbi:MAG: DUF805 domain-containing protein, partial [Alphaproteobacteria bacterium]|nr:DUF805 domain-containing protein [Alphaproteobacteria bacterium]